MTEMAVSMQSDLNGNSRSLEGSGQSLKSGFRRLVGRARTAVAPSHNEAGADGHKWFASAEKILGFLVSSGNPRIIGITGDERGAGCSNLVRTLAQAYQLLGKRVLFIDASAGELGVAAPATAQKPPRTFNILSDVGIAEGMHRVCLRAGDLDGVDAESFRRSCNEAVTFDHIIMDLQPLAASIAETDSGARVSSAACDAILLVCLTARAQEPNLQMRLHAARLQNFKIAGLVLNDKGVGWGRLMTNSI